MLRQDKAEIQKKINTVKKLMNSKCKTSYN